MFLSYSNLNSIILLLINYGLFHCYPNPFYFICLSVNYPLYMPFLTFSYINILGFLSFIVSLSQLSSGILLSIYHNDFFIIASDPIIYMIININNG